MVILSVISLFYQRFAANRYVALMLKGMSCGVAAVILDVSVSLGKNILKEKKWTHTVLMITAFAATFFLKINVIWIILFAAVIGVVLSLAERKGGKQHDPL